MRFALEKLVDILLAIMVIGVILTFAMFSNRNESLWSFDELAGELKTFHQAGMDGNEIKDFAQVVILDQRSALVFFKGQQNVQYKYNVDGEYNFLYGTNFIGHIFEINVPGYCQKNCLCVMDDFEVTNSGKRTTLTDNYPVCMEYEFEIIGESMFGDRAVYNIENGWVLERGLASYYRSDAYYFSSGDDREGSVVQSLNRQLQSRRRPLYINFVDKKIHLYQFQKMHDPSLDISSGVEQSLDLNPLDSTQLEQDVSR